MCEEGITNEERRLELVNCLVAADIEEKKRQAFRTYLAAVVQGTIAHTGGFKTIEVHNMVRGLIGIEEAEFSGAEERAPNEGR